MDRGQEIRGSIWPDHLTGLTRLLVQLRERFDGDLDLVLVLAVIGSQSRPAPRPTEFASAPDMTNTQHKDESSKRCNFQSVSQSSGIPRETVRRKVSILQNKGWVSRDADGQLSVSLSGANALADETRHLLFQQNDAQAALDAES